MSSDVFVIYQIDNSEKNREYRCRSYEYQIQHIRSNGFSKVSFCKKTEISRPTLDKILNGEIDSKSTFDKHLNKILTSLSIDPDTLMGFSPRVQSVDAVYSQNAPIDYQMNDKAKIFPGREWCEAYAPTVYKYPVLLPFFWVWRLIYKGITNRKKVTQEIKTIKAGKQN